jgi:AmmeMemoRadiSam system protein A
MSPLNNEEQSFLVSLARKSLEAAVRAGPARVVSVAVADIPSALAAPGSAFVTLHAMGARPALRGCVGFLDRSRPLYKTVMDAAAAAALHDTRFPPVSPQELNGLTIEISVLSPFRKVRPEEIEVGVHGLTITQGAARGLLLPQVAVERNWTAMRFLEETCKKAGLGPGAWRSGARIEAFTAQIFGELDRETAPKEGSRQP